MKLKWSAGQAGPPLATVPTFDFIIGARPKYIPGSGPPLAPITIMPPHDKDGFIIDKVHFKKQLRYLVGYKHHPQLKVSVQPQNILDWVSRYALEDWESKRYEAEEKRREEEELPAILAKEERRRKRLEAMSRAAQGIDGRKLKRKRPADEYAFGTSDRPAKLGRVGRPPRTKYMAQSGLAGREQPEEEIVFTSPRLTQRSPLSQQPSLSTPSRRFTNRTIIEEESNGYDSVDTDMAIDLQLGLTDTARTPRSSRKSLDRLGEGQTRSLSNFNEADSSNDEGRGGTPIESNRRPSFLPDHNAVAATSSREALKIYEDLERKNRSSANPLTVDAQSPLKQTPSLFSSYADYKRSNPTFSTPARSLPLQPRILPKDFQYHPLFDGREDTEEESEYEINKILDQDLRRENGKQVVYYLIDWVGDEYESTWEPAENVSPEAIADFKERLREERTSMRLNGESSVDRAHTWLEEFGTGNGKGKRNRVRGAVIDSD